MPHNCRLPLSDAGYATIPFDVREQHGIEKDAEAIVQGIGPYLQVAVPNCDATLLVRLHTEAWLVTDPYDRQLCRGGVHVDRWREQLRTVDLEGEGLHAVGEAFATDLHP